MKIVFMGTPEFAVPALTALVTQHDVVGVVTQPDKRKGRGKTMGFSPVKEAALRHNIPVYQPVRVRDEEFMEILKSLKPDVIVVAAFGQILPESILNLPPYGCVNIHASLLPRYRGAAPIQWAILNGESETGLTAMLMDKGLDTGDMLRKVTVPIEEKETGETLHDKLAAAGGPLILDTLLALEEGTAKRTPQREEDSCYAKMLTKEMGEIDWTKSAVSIERLVRGMNAWPSAYTFLDQKTVKIWDADAVKGTSDVPAGAVAAVERDAFLVQTGDGLLRINELQLQGKKRMAAGAFLRGYPLKKGMTYGR